MARYLSSCSVSADSFRRNTASTKASRGAGEGGQGREAVLVEHLLGARVPEGDLSVLGHFIL